MSRKPYVATAVLVGAAITGIVAAPSAFSIIGPNAGDIAASSPATPGGSVTLTVTTGFACDAGTTFDPADSTAWILSQDGNTTIVNETPLVANATGGTLTVMLPSDLPIGTYTMQFLCNSDVAGFSVFGSNEFEVTAALPTTTTTAAPTTTAPAAAAAATVSPSFTG